MSSDRSCCVTFGEITAHQAAPLRRPKACDFQLVSSRTEATRCGAAGAAPRWSQCQPCETAVCAQKQLMETGSAPCVSLSLHATHTQLPKRRARDYALPLACRANRQPPPCPVLCRSFPHACALNYPLPLARLPTSANCPRASPQQVASGPAAVQLLAPTRAAADSHRNSCTAEGVGVPPCRTRVRWELVEAVLHYTVAIRLLASCNIKKRPSKCGKLRSSAAEELLHGITA